MFPDLGTPDLNVYELVGTLVDYKNSHPTELAKEKIGGWFADLQERLRHLNEETGLMEKPRRSDAKSLEGNVRQQASVADGNMMGIDNRRVAELWDLTGRIKRQLETARRVAAQRGIPEDWLAKPKDENE